MPKPEIHETEKDFLHRCIPELIHEGRSRSQSAAICYSYYRREGTETKSPKPEKRNPNIRRVGSQISNCEKCDKKLRYTCCDMLENV